MTRPDFIAHWSELENAEPQSYSTSGEHMGFDASLGRKLGLTRLGIHHVRLPPGQRPPTRTRKAWRKSSSS